MRGAHARWLYSYAERRNTRRDALKGCRLTMRSLPGLQRRSCRFYCIVYMNQVFIVCPFIICIILVRHQTPRSAYRKSKKSCPFVYSMKIGLLWHSAQLNLWMLFLSFVFNQHTYIDSMSANKHSTQYKCIA